MKKRLSVLLLIVMLGLCAGPVMAGGNEVNVVVNGVALAEKGLAVDGRTLVPLRAIGEAMGLQVDYWDGMIEVCNADKSLYLGMALGQKNVYVGSESKSQEIDVAPQAINGVTMVPIRFIGDFFGSEVNWDQATKTVSVGGVKDAGGKEANTQLPSEPTEFAKVESDWEYLEKKGLEVQKCSIDAEGNVEIIIKNIGTDLKMELLTVIAYNSTSNLPIENEEIGFIELLAGDSKEYKFKMYRAAGMDCYLVINNVPY